MYKSIAVAASAAVVALGSMARPVVAQSDGALAAYTALAFTPTGCLTPIVRPWMAGIPHSGIGVDARWGNLSEGDLHMKTFVAGLAIPTSGGRGDAALSAGYLSMGCDGCDGHFVASLAGEQGLLRRELDGRGTQFGLGINGSLGFGKPDGAMVWSAMLGTPIYLATGKPGKTQLVPFMTPSVGWGLVAPDNFDSQSGVRFVLGGGIGIVNVAPGVNVQLGLQKTFIQRGKMVLGAGLSYSVPR